MKIFSTAVLLASLSIQCGATTTTTIDDVFTDTTAPSEALVKKVRYDWQKKPVIVMDSPSKDSLPTWWNYAKPDWCYTVIPWFVLYEGANNQALNTRVEIKNLRFFVYSQARRQWEQFDIKLRPTVDVWKDPFNYFGGPNGARVEQDGGVSMKPVWGADGYFFHGYGNTVTITPQDVRATFVAMEFRLVVDDVSKSDDRDSAEYVLDVGGDYYPGNGQGGWGVSYAPGMGNGRMLKPTKEWRTATMLIPNSKIGADYPELQSNPPPLDAP
jgi:hypothetical protein